MKKEIRSLIQKKRKTMHFSEVSEKSRRIKDQLFSMKEFKDAGTILFYVSYDNEVYTHEMIKESLGMKKQVVVPKTDMNNRTIICSSLTMWDDLLSGAYNILEPRQECVNEVSPESIDLMIIPGVAFDSQGNRIGHGMGDHVANPTSYHPDNPHPVLRQTLTARLGAAVPVAGRARRLRTRRAPGCSR